MLLLKKHVILKKTEHAAEQMSNKTKRKNKSIIVLYIILKSATLCVQEWYIYNVVY